MALPGLPKGCRRNTESQDICEEGIDMGLKYSYSTLDIDVDASAEEIKRAFRRQGWHCQRQRE
jgi:DnaJ-class molecular chaperone